MIPKHECVLRSDYELDHASSSEAEKEIESRRFILLCLYVTSHTLSINPHAPSSLRHTLHFFLEAAIPSRSSNYGTVGVDCRCRSPETCFRPPFPTFPRFGEIAYRFKKVEGRARPVWDE